MMDTFSQRKKATKTKEVGVEGWTKFDKGGGWGI